MLQAVQLRVVSSPFSHPYLYPVRFLPQAVPTSSRPSPKAISHQPLGVLLTLLNATLTRALVRAIIYLTDFFNLAMDAARMQ